MVTDLILGSAKSKYSFVSKLTVFQALFNSKEYATPIRQGLLAHRGYELDNALSVNVTTILQVTLAWQLLYDKEIDLGGRFKEALTLGLSYKFANFEGGRKEIAAFLGDSTRVKSLPRLLWILIILGFASG